MPEPIKIEGEGSGGEGEAPKIDMFGEAESVEGAEAGTEEKEIPKNETAEQKTAREAKEKEGKEGEGADIEKHPVVVALKKQVEDFGKNTSGQGKLIKKLMKQIETLTGGKGGEAGAEEGVLFKEIKKSKDLTQAERDEMTEAEIKQFDEIATLKEGMNNLAKLVKPKDKEEEGEDDDDEDGVGDADKVEDLGKEARSVARELADNDTDMANAILAEFNQFAGNDKLTKTELKERMLKAGKLVPDFKAPKEQPTKKGKTVGAGGKGADKDPFGVDKIVEDATKPNNGNYKL